MNYIPTGNEYVSIPTIREDNAAIESLNLILMQLDGLLELCGGEGRSLLSCPSLESAKGPLSWSFREDWIPEFVTSPDSDDQGYVVAPPGQKFCIYHVPHLAETTEFALSIGDVFQTANVRHHLPRVDFVVQRFSWPYETGIVVHLFAGSILATLAVRGLGECEYVLIRDGETIPLTSYDDSYRCTGPFEIKIACKGEPTLVIGTGFSAVGAMSAALEVSRRPPEAWLSDAENYLANLRVIIPRDEALSRKANRNGHFARYFGMGKTTDTEEVVSMTSRSHRYYVSSAYWDRDSLLWLYPFLLRNDKKLAADLLRYAYGRQLRDAGIHSRYISGRILEYGFELDELLAPLVAIGSWNEAYPAEPIWEEENIAKGMIYLLEKLRDYRHKAAPLYWTDLMPTDDLVVDQRNVLTYNNVLLLHALWSCEPILQRISPKWAGLVASEVATVADAIRTHLVQDDKFLWSSDLAGDTEFYDEAAGSLVLLPYYGFCEPSDPIYKNTLDHLYSGAYPYLRKGAFSELGNRHTDSPHPWVLSACNSVLSGARVSEGMDFLQRTPLDNGIACESVNIDTGEPETGYHFATCAGFVAHAIMTGAQLGISSGG